MRKNIDFLSILLTLSILICAASSLASQFQADVLDSREIESFKGHIWVKDGVYRLEMDRPDSPDNYTIVGSKVGTTQIVFPKYKVYMELPSSEMLSQMNDPFQAARTTAERYQLKSEGKENIQGFECDRQLIHADGQGIMQRWQSTELDFPVKIEQLSRDDWYVLLENIEQKEVEDTLFQIPAEYTLKSYDEISKLIESDQDLAAKVAAYKKNRPRKLELANLLSTDDTWSLVLNPDIKVRVKVKTGNKQAAWFAVPYKGQTPLKSKSDCMYQGKGNISIDPDLGADGILVGVTEGDNISVNLVLVGKPPHVQAMRRVFHVVERSGSGWSVQNSFLKYEVRVYARSSPAAGVRFKVDGKEYDVKIPSGQFKLFSISSQDNPKDMDIMVDYGKVKVVYLANARTASGTHVLLDIPPQEKDGTAVAVSSSPEPDVTPPQSTAAPQVASQVAPETATQAAPQAESSSEKMDNEVRTILVLDASGSMWGQIDGQAKIVIAKEVMTDLIDNLSDNSYAGLVAYGHRRKGDCQDVEELVPLQAIDKKRLVEQIQAINPKGKTPITRSIRMTAEKLKTVEEETTIILVSDGKETCEGDPCALVKELKEAGVRFTMYVIGFDVSKEERTQLECMARAGDGQYFTAKNAQELRLAANAAVQESHNFGYLKIFALRNGKHISARVDVFKHGKQEAIRSIHAVTDPSKPGAKLKPGAYDVMVIDEEFSPPQKAAFSEVTVEAGRTTEKIADFNGGSLSVEVLANGKKETASLYLYPAGDSQVLKTADTSRDNPTTFVLHPGKYDLQVVYKKARPEIERRLSNIEIVAGQINEKRVEFGEGKLSIEVSVNGLKGSAGLSIYRAGTNNRIATGDTSRDNPKTFTLDPGAYDLEVVYKDSKPESKQRIDGIEIKAGQVSEKRIEFGEGQLSVEVLVNDKKGPAGMYIYEAGTNNRIATGDTSRDNPKVISLNAGNYDLKVVYRKAIPEKEVIIENLQIAQGQTTPQKVTYQEGTLNVKVTSGGSPTRGGLSFYLPGESKRVATGNAGKTIKMQPGQYEVVVKAYKLDGKPEKRVPFTIQTGQSTNLDVNF